VVSLNGLTGGSSDAWGDGSSALDSGDDPDSASATDADAGGTSDSAVSDGAHVVDSSPDAAEAGGGIPDGSGGVDAGSVYAAAVLADGPQGYFRFDETSGTTAHDSSGHGNDAQYVGGFTRGAPGALIGDKDTAVTLDGTSGYADVGNRFNFTGNATFTLEVWALPSVIDVNYRRLFSREVPTTPRDGYLLFLRSPNGADPSTYSVERWSSGSTNQCPETNLVTAVWHHFVTTYDGSTSRVYLDAMLVASQPGPLPMNATTASLRLGASAFDSNGYFGGTVDEAAIYDTALSAARITAHFHASGR
jgi:hypothetical protein